MKLKITLTKSPIACLQKHIDTVKALGQEKSFGFSAAVDSLTRFRLMTKEKIPHLSTVDDCGKWGVKEQVLPGGEEPVAESVIRLRDIRWQTEA